LKKERKKYKKPLKPWDKERIEKEREIIKTYGLKKKKEIWKTEALVRKFRRMARNLAARKDNEKERILIEKLIKMGVLEKGATLDDVLSLTVENLLERRLQTIIFRKGLANTAKHSRQLIVHGHIKINDRKIIYPSYLVMKEEEDNIKLNLEK